MWKSVETIEEYDSNGKLVKKTVTETIDEENKPVLAPEVPCCPTYPDHYPWCGIYQLNHTGTPFTTDHITITRNCKGE